MRTNGRTTSSYATFIIQMKAITFSAFALHISFYMFVKPELCKPNGAHKLSLLILCALNSHIFQSFVRSVQSVQLSTWINFNQIQYSSSRKFENLRWNAPVRDIARNGYVIACHWFTKKMTTTTNGLSSRHETFELRRCNCRNSEVLYCICASLSSTLTTAMTKSFSAMEFHLPTNPSIRRFYGIEAPTQHFSSLSAVNGIA